MKNKEFIRIQRTISDASCHFFQKRQICQSFSWSYCTKVHVLQRNCTFHTFPWFCWKGRLPAITSSLLPQKEINVLEEEGEGAGAETPLFLTHQSPADDPNCRSCPGIKLSACRRWWMSSFFFVLFFQQVWEPDMANSFLFLFHMCGVRTLLNKKHWDRFLRLNSLKVILGQPQQGLQDRNFGAFPYLLQCLSVWLSEQRLGLFLDCKFCCSYSWWTSTAIAYLG